MVCPLEPTELCFWGYLCIIFTFRGGGMCAGSCMGRGMDLNPELLSAIDRLCVGLVVQCMFQCRVHNLNRPQRYAKQRG